MRRYPIIVFLVVALVAIACAKDLDSLAPFPCAEDGTCPSGFDCTAQKQCVTPPTCSGQETDCAGVCLQTASDAKNCGSCGKSCPDSEVCCGGSCCASASCCGAIGSQSCVLDFQSDAKNCSRCDNACPSYDVCESGTCTCEPPNMACSSGCSDISVDRNNCGQCEHVCPPGDICQDSTCQCPRCGGTTCVDVLNDVSNCGACGVVANYCVNGCSVANATSTCVGAPLCGCAAGENCFEFNNTWACGLGGTVPVGGTCTKNGDCVPGSVCDEKSGGLSICEAYCNPEAPCPTGYSCCQLVLVDSSISSGSTCSQGSCY
jgi:hypothetical protein